MNERYVVLGLGHSRSRWFSDLARWSTSAVAPIDYVKCLTVVEARAVMGAGRRLSAVVVDASVDHLDRDFIALATAIGAATIVVTDGSVSRDWDALGCAGILPLEFGPELLIETLARCATPVDRSTRRTATASVEPHDHPEAAPLIGVTGPGGTGSSTVAMALAQAFARSAELNVALADGARIADMAMYHDVGDVIPGLPELVEAHRVDEPDPEEVRRLLFSIETRGYHLLLGQRRARDAAAMRPRSITASIDSLRRSFDAVVIDHDPDLDGELDTGSVEIEERHALSRSTAERADLVLLVGRPGMKGVNDLIRLVDRFADVGVPRERLVPVINAAPRSHSERAATTKALAELTRPSVGEGRPSAPPLFLRSIRTMEDVHRSAAPMPESLTQPLGRAVRHLLLGLGSRSIQAADGEQIRPGDLRSPRAVADMSRPRRGIRHRVVDDQSDVA